MPQPKEDEKNEFFSNLRKLAPKAAVLSSCYEDKTLQHKYKKYPTLSGLPTPIMSLGRMKYTNLEEEELEHECARVFEEMGLTIEESQYLFRGHIKAVKKSAMV